MKQAKVLARRQKNRPILLRAEKSELSSGLRTPLDYLAGPDGSALKDLAPVFYGQFIEAALARIDSAEYDLCMDCGDAISRGRLEAIPWAVRCAACQELSSSDTDSSFASDPARLE